MQHRKVSASKAPAFYCKKSLKKVCKKVDCEQNFAYFYIINLKERDMNEIKRLIDELAAQMSGSAEAALNLAMVTGDEDFAALSAIIPMLMAAIQKCELLELVEIMAKFAETKTSKTPVADLTRDDIENRIFLN